MLTVVLLTARYHSRWRFFRRVSRNEQYGTTTSTHTRPTPITVSAARPHPVEAQTATPYVRRTQQRLVARGETSESPTLAGHRDVKQMRILMTGPGIVSLENFSDQTG